MRMITVFLIAIVFVISMLSFVWTNEKKINDRGKQAFATEHAHGRTDRTQEYQERYVSSIVAQVSDSTITEYMHWLVDFRTRLSCTDSSIAASQWIYDKFVEFGFTEVYFDSFSLNHPQATCDIGRNVVAVKYGSINPDNVIVIGGHYDSVTTPPSECDPDTLAPGADDNASGISATLETARIFSQMDNEITLIFVAFDAEELGAPGSDHYSKAVFDQGLDIRLMINLDVISYLEDDVWDLELRIDPTALPFSEIFSEMAYTHTDLLPEIVVADNVGGDGYGFNVHGYSAIWPMEGDLETNIFVHDCYDIVENMSIPYLTDATRMVVASILSISEDPDVPTGFEIVNIGNGTSLFSSWNKNKESDLAGYNIYWGTRSGIYDSVRTVNAEQVTINNLLEDSTYYFALSAFDTENNESFLTEEISLVTSSVPLTPTGITSTSLDSMIVIQWENRGGELDLAGYNVYRRTIDVLVDTVLLDFIPDPVTTISDLSAEVHKMYGYHVTAIDTENPPNESEPSDEVYGQRATHDLGVLVVDNTSNGSGGPFSPTDEEVDDYYSDLLSNYNVQAFWDAGDSIGSGRRIMDYDLGVYSTVVWHQDVRGAHSGDTDTTTMRKYLEGGGNLWLSGWRVLEFLTGSVSLYQVFEESEFVHQYLGVDSAMTTSTSEIDFVGVDSIAEDFPSIRVDADKTSPLGALYNMDILLPPFDGTIPIYGYVSSDSSSAPHHGLPVAVVNGSADYVLVVTLFPLYYMQETGTGLLVDTVMALFSEPVSINEGDVAVSLPRSYALSQNYPNPFNPSTTILYDIPAGDPVPVTINIYDIRGRLVRKFIHREKAPGTHQVHWNGNNSRGAAVSSGVYLYRIEAGGFVSTRKMLLVR